MLHREPHTIMQTDSPPASTPPKHDLASLRIRREDPDSRGRGVGGALLLTVVIVAVALALGYGFLRLRPRFESVNVETTRVTAVSPTDSDQILTATGYVVARVKADVSSRIVGRLAELNVEEGTRVKRGAILARLEDADYRAAVAEARAVSAEAEQQRARLEKLVAAKIASQADLDAQIARAGSAKARVDLAEANLENTIIRAPFAGVVLTKKAKVGETVSPGGFSGSGSSSSSSAIVTLADFSTLEVEADVAEANIGRVAAGQPSEIAVEAISDRHFKGRLDRVVPTADRQKATVQVKVRFDDTDKRLLPEMQATVRFLKTGSTAIPAPPKILIPASAVETRSDGDRVRLIEDGALSTRRIESIPGENGRVEVTKGLVGGEELVLSGAGGHSDGTKIKPVSASGVSTKK